MKTTTISGFSVNPRLKEIAPEIPGAGDFIGLNAGYVGGFLGQRGASELYRIEHDVLEYGRHWRMLFRQQHYTPAGLVLIIEELNKRGYAGEALALRMHVNQKIADLRRAAPDAAAVPVDEVALSRRWDRRSEVMA